jgi:hypothetical protein
VEIGGIVSKFAVMLTALFGIVNVVVALLGFAKATPPLVTIQFANCCPIGGVPAVIVTTVPCVAVV